jgi:hypothetical protein
MAKKKYILEERFCNKNPHIRVEPSALIRHIVQVSILILDLYTFQHD